MLNRLRLLRTNENILIAIDGLLHSKSAFLTTFLMTYMIRLSADGSPIDFIVYRLMVFVTMAVLSLALLHFIKKHTLLAWRLGMFFSILQVVVIITLHDQPDLFPYVLALVTSLESTLYWRPTMFYTITEVPNARRLRFLSVRQIITEVIKILMPIFLGLFITGNGFMNAAIFILAVSIFQFILSILFRPARTIHLPAHHARVVVRKLINHRSLRRILYLQFFRGLVASGSALLIIPSLLVYNSTNSDLDLGLYASIGAVLAIVIILFYRRLSRNKRKSRSFLAALIPITFLFVILPVLSSTSLPAILFYIFAIAIFDSFLNMLLSNRIQSSLKKHLGENSFTIEVESVSEVFLSVGRVISLSALLFVISASGTAYLPHFAAVSALFLIPTLLLAQSAKKFIPFIEPE